MASLSGNQRRCHWIPRGEVKGRQEDMDASHCRPLGTSRVFRIFLHWPTSMESGANRPFGGYSLQNEAFGFSLLIQLPRAISPFLDCGHVAAACAGPQYCLCSLKRPGSSAAAACFDGRCSQGSPQAVPEKSPPGEAIRGCTKGRVSMQKECDTTSS